MEEKENYYQLSHPQKRIWYVEKIHSNAPLHNIGGCLKIKKNINIEILCKAINLVVKLNDNLRMRFFEEDGRAFQFVSEYEEEKFDFIDFSYYKDSLKRHEIWTKKIFAKNFEIENSKLYYFAIYKINDQEFGILLKIHHIISDGWSISLIQNQVCKFYEDMIEKQKTQQKSAYSYLNYINKEKEYLESNRFIKNKCFWGEMLKDLPQGCLYRSSDSTKGRRISFNIDTTLSCCIKKFCKDNSISLNTFFISILLLYLYKSTGMNDLIIGTPVFNRVDKEDKRTLGMYTSTIPIRFKFEQHMTIEQYVKKVNSNIKRCYLNQRYPYDLIINDLELNKMGYDSLFKVCVNYYNSSFTQTLNNIPLSLEEHYSGHQAYSLQLIVKEWLDSGVITLNFDYKISEYDREDILYMYKYFINIMKTIVSNNKLDIDEFSLLDENELKNKILNINRTYSDYPRNKTIYELFEEQATQTPNDVALSFENKSMSYRQLSEKSNKLALYLINKGVISGDIITIIAEHSFELIVGILGIMKAGAAYLPIDHNYPTERINYMIEDTNSCLILTNIDLHNKIDFKKEIINLNNETLYLNEETKLNVRNKPNDLAYIIYTSGSTGKPKGVMIEHKGLVNYVCWAQKTYTRGKEIFALYSSISFDLTITSIFTPLISGGNIEIYKDDGKQFILDRILNSNKATIIKLTPSHLMLIKDRDNRKSSIETLIVGGENLRTTIAKEICESFGKEINIYNEYGPTEAVVGCMIYKYSSIKDRTLSVPIGKPADNVQVYILDKNLKIVPTGVVGELYVSSDGIARGYLNMDKLTKERFICNPFNESKIMYRTGDLAKYLMNGNILYIGRSDNQIKIRGHRIEIGEIEKCLLQNDFVKEAIVIDKKNKNGDTSLYAYISLRKPIVKKELKKWLSSFLPAYMIPSNFIYIDEMPLNSNGKIDKLSLPEPEEHKKEIINFTNDVEKKLVEIMKAILQVDNISMDDNFYMIGGDSIKAIQIASKLNNENLSINIKDILTNETIKEIASCIEDKGICNSTIDQKQISGYIENTPIIQWFFNENFEKDSYYNQSILIQYRDNIDYNMAKIAAKKLVVHHDALRINLNRKNSKLYYNNSHLTKTDIVNYVDISMYNAKERLLKIKEIGEKIKSEIDIEKDILIKICYFDLKDEYPIILFTCHHIAIDTVSWRILLNDFNTLIHQQTKEENLLLPPKTNSYKEWSMELNNYKNSLTREEEDYWGNVLSKEFFYPVDFNLGKDLIKFSSTLYSNLDEETTQNILINPYKIYGLELKETLAIALALTINKLTNQSDIIIELEGHGREQLNERININRTVGWFTSMYPVFFRIEKYGIDYNLKCLKEIQRNIPNNGFNFGIFKYLKNSFNKSYQKYIRFNYLGDFDNSLNDGIIKILDEECGSNIGVDNHLPYLIEFIVMIINKKIRINVTYSNNKFKRKTIENIIDTYIKTLQEINYLCLNKTERGFTPSDFELIDISQEDLDKLFDN